MRLVWGLDGEIARYVAAHFPIVLERGGYDTFKAVGFADEEDRIFGGLVVSEYRGHDADLSIFAERPGFINRRILREFFHWAFNVEGFRRLTAKVAKKNKRSRRLVEGLGFRLEGTQKYGFDDAKDDLCLYGMTYDRCPWLITP